MRLSLVVFLLCAIRFGTVTAQDLIVTGKGDSLNCKITSIKDDYIHFTFKYENEIRNTLLAVGQIRSYKTNFFSQPEVPLEKVAVAGNYQKVRIGIHGGWSYMTARVDDNLPASIRQYIKELKSGYHFGGDVGFFASEYIGFGMKYTMFKTQNQDNTSMTDPNTGQTRTGIVKDDITIHYVGPAIFTRFYSSKKRTSVLTGFSLGYLAYINKATWFDDFTMTGSNIGLTFDLGVDFMLEKNLALGFGFSYTGGTLREYEIKAGNTKHTISLKDDQVESISRIDLSVGLRWNF